MTEETTQFEEELKEETKRATERISVAGSELIKTVQALLREATVRKITVLDKNGRTLIEFPLYAGIIGAVFVGSWTVLALIAAWFAEVSILIERDIDSDTEFAGGEPSAAAEAVSRAAGAVGQTAETVGHKASSAAREAVSGLGAAIGGVAHAAGDLARRAADSLDGRLHPEDLGEDLMAKGEKAAQAIIEAAEAAAEPRQCVALTKSGSRCKRTAVAGSDYCATHQPK